MEKLSCIAAPRILGLLLLFLTFSAFSALPAEPEITVTTEKSGEAFVINAIVETAAPLRIVWDVLTDFDNMAGIVSNLTSSKIIRRRGNSLRITQEGTARYGIFSYSIASERDIRLEPMKRIVSRQISGNAKSFESEMELTLTGQEVKLNYHAEMVPDSFVARAFGASFVQHEIEEQLKALTAEMGRRQAQ